MVMRRLFKLGAGVLLLAGLWFVAVDRSWFVQDCPDCGYEKDVTQYRVFGCSIHQSTRDFRPLTQKVATDLGVPCQHLNTISWHKHRWWGLCICKAPCINGTYRLSEGESSYSQSDSSKVAALAARDPKIATEFSRRVLQQHEFAFIREILDRAGVQIVYSDAHETK